MNAVSGRAYYAAPDPEAESPCSKPDASEPTESPESAPNPVGHSLAACRSAIVHGVTFDTGEDTLREDATPALEQILAGLEANPDASARILGHTDADGSDESNVDLSPRSAATVVEWLTGRGVDAARLSAGGKGVLESRNEPAEHDLGCSPCRLDQQSSVRSDDLSASVPSTSKTLIPQMEHTMTIHPYLFFTGTCRETMTRYQEILGGELEVMTVGDMPEGEEPPPGPPNPDMVIHAALDLGDGDLIMASDDPTGDGSGMKGMAVSLTLTDADEVTRIFEALAEGGETTMPIGETFWSPLFGMCTDRFGTSWMVDLEAAEVQG